jgi:lysophospholipase L1-like esterase
MNVCDADLRDHRVLMMLHHQNRELATWLIGVALLVAACGSGGGHGTSQLTLEDVNHDGQIVLLAFGDSITRGVGDGPGEHDAPPAPAGYPLRLQNLLGVTVIDDGNPGELTSDGMQRLLGSLEVNHPDYAILLEGTNDVLGGDGNAAVGNMRSMIKSVFAAGAVPLLGTITPICCDTEAVHPQSVILSYNDNIRALAEDEGVVLIDFYSAFTGAPEAEYDPSRGLIHQPEGIHPTPAGYDVMAATVASLFRQ